MKTRFNARTTGVRLVEAEGFRDGANGVSPEHTQNEITATCERRKAEVREEMAQQIKTLEAQAQTLRPRADEAQARWEAIKQEYGSQAPHLVKPICLLLVSLGAIAAEAFLLAPMLDMIGIADPDWQLWTAAGIITAAGILIHFCLEHREQHKSWWPVLVSGLTVIGLTLVGLMRAEQVAFAATVSGSLFGEFLKAHPLLRQAVFVFLTLLFPVAATLIPHTSMEQLHNWWRFRKARKQAIKLGQAASKVEKKLEGKREELDAQLHQLDDQAQEWQSAYATYYELGRAIGAKRPPRWTIWAKATAAALVVFAVATLLSVALLGGLPIGLAIAGLAATASWLIAAVYFYRRWEHPSALRYLKWARLQFREGDENSRMRRISSQPVADPAAEQNLLPERSLAERVTLRR